MWPFSRAPVVPVLRFHGPIGMSTPLRPGLSISTAAPVIERAFALSKLPAVAVSINSPGGSPVQSSLIFKRVRQLAEEKKKKVYVFCEDVAASGGYYLAATGDEIHADASSIIGSIGVISASFGLDKAIEKLGVERRVYTSGTSKGALDPFRPENADDIARLKAIQRDIHDVFIGVIKDRRAEKLKGPDEELFSGAFWSAARALELGLIDGVSDLRTRMRELFGDKVRLKPIAISSGGLLGRFRRVEGAATLGTAGTSWPDLAALGDLAGGALPDQLISALEARALWARYGL